MSLGLLSTHVMDITAVAAPCLEAANCDQTNEKKTPHLGHVKALSAVSVCVQL